jgi:hypothetical protein
VRVRRHRPVRTSHQRTVSSRPPVTTCRSQRAIATDITQPVCPVRVRRQRPVVTSHHLATPSSPLVRAYRPLALSATANVPPVCAERLYRERPLARSQYCTVPFPMQPDKQWRPSGVSATELMAPPSAG